MRPKSVQNPSTNTDDIFSDNGPALGADPFILNENAIKPSTVGEETGLKGELVNFSQSILKLFSLLDYQHSFEFIIQEVSRILSLICESTNATGVIYEYQSEDRLFFERASKQVIEGDAALYDALRTGQLQYTQSHFYQPILVTEKVYGVFVVCVEHPEKVQHLSKLLSQAATAVGKIIENRLVMAYLSKNSADTADERAA